MIVEGNTLEKQRSVCSLDQFNIKKIAQQKKWEASGATEYSKDCHGWFNWLHPKMLAKLLKIQERKISKRQKQNTTNPLKCLTEIEVIQLTRIFGSPCFVRLTWYVMLML